MGPLGRVYNYRSSQSHAACLAFHRVSSEFGRTVLMGFVGFWVQGFTLKEIMR